MTSGIKLLSYIAKECRKEKTIMPVMEKDENDKNREIIFVHTHYEKYACKKYIKILHNWVFILSRFFFQPTCSTRKSSMQNDKDRGEAPMALHPWHSEARREQLNHVFFV